MASSLASVTRTRLVQRGRTVGAGQQCELAVHGSPAMLAAAEIMLVRDDFIVALQFDRELVNVSHALILY